MTTAIDVKPGAFESQVIEESHRRPVVVDFWAPWCGPCRALGPVLEKLAAEDRGRWLLAKLNTEEDLDTAAQFGIRSIPAVKAIVKGKVVKEFVGALPAHQIRAWLEDLVPGPAEEALARAKEAESTSAWEEAKEAYKEALSHKALMPAAVIGLARVALACDEPEEAQSYLGQLLHIDDEALLKEANALRLQLQGGADDTEVEALHARIVTNDDDVEAHLALGKAYGAQQRYEAALEHLLTVIKKDRGESREEARQTMVKIFGSMGMQDPLVKRYRSQLSQWLYR